MKILNSNLENVKIADKDIEFIFCEVKARLHKNKIIKYLSGLHDEDVKTIVDYLKNNAINTFPYEYKREYSIKDISVQRDVDSGLLFVKDADMSIYMRRGYQSKFRVARYYNNIRIEQDKSSPHCYTSNTFYPDEGSVIFDIGGAEGYFPLQWLRHVKKVFIFECNPEWIEALNKTYKDYKDKIVIIEKFVTDYTDSNHVTLDDVINQYNLHSEKLFIKIDAEGSEPAVLGGGYWVIKILSKY